MDLKQNMILKMLFREVFKYFSLILLIIVSIPVSIIIAFIIKIESSGPVIHWSKRVGLNNKIFLMPKFRTMSSNTPQLATHLLNSSKKKFITKFGSYLRKYSFDEIPQLFSILKGDMNFIGPRPALFNQYDLIEKRSIKGIHKFKPGITGYAQINGRDSINIIQKVDLDFFYTTNKSLKLDLNILFKTFFRVLIKKDISH